MRVSPDLQVWEATWPGMHARKAARPTGERCTYGASGFEWFDKTNFRRFMPIVVAAKQAEKQRSICGVEKRCTRTFDAEGFSV